ncbi:MAG TPA: ABC transporter permease [Lachnospiraceae bacterium]|nr:ABC transporter permease [Lachnospiraceae bacterium]
MTETKLSQRNTERQKFLKKKQFKTNTIPAIITVGPIALWLLAFIVIPMIYVIVISFMSQGDYGYIQYQLTTENYTEMLQPTYLRIFGITIVIAIISTITVLLISYPIAYFIAKQKGSRGGYMIMLMMIPSWTIGLVRTYSWVRILQNKGILNGLLQWLKLIDSPVQFLYNNGAVAFGTILSLMTFSILPLYSSIEKLDDSFLEASKDLGAKPFQVLRTVILPLTSGGIFASIILTFIPALGIYIIADIYGGGKILYLGNLIRNQMLINRNWPFGCALSVLLIGITLLMLFVFTRFYNLEDLEV